MRPRLTLAALLTLPCLMISCDPTEADCRQLVARLNAAVDRMRPQRVRDAGPPDEVAAAMRRFGSAIGKEADTLAALPIEAPKLIAERDAYVQAARRSSAAATAWADALEAMSRARGEGDAAKAALDANVDELDELCRASTCFELMQRLARSANAPIGQLPKELDALADDLDQISTEVAEVDAAIARHEQQIRRLAEALRAMREAEAEASRQRRALVEAAMAEEPVVARINAICRP